MRQRVSIYIYLVFSAIVQVVLMRKVSWGPDLILLVVVFSGIFYGVFEGMVVGFIAGSLRSVFSSYNFVFDVVLFSAAGLLSFILSRAFYRRNPLAQVFAVMVILGLVISAQILYLNATSGNDISVFAAMKESFPVIMTTLITAPFLFYFLGKDVKLID